MKKVLLLFFSVFLFVLADIFLEGCKRDPIVAVNPYDDVNYHPDSSAEANPDPNSITGLHKNIFSTRCALPGCHDGTFEPDYRTVQSTFSTLVYQPVNKYTVDSVKYFSYRVIPYDTINSFLHERITTHTSDYMPSNGTRLKEEDIQHINTWIMSGARDQFGTLPVKPDNPPQVAGFIAVDSTFKHELDSFRIGGLFYNPFLVKPNMTVYMEVFVSDDHDTLPSLLVNQLKLSLSKDDFSSAITYNATYIPSAKGWIVSFKTAYPSGTTVYMRYYVNDHTHSTPTEFPRNDSPFYFKTYSAFYVQ